MRTMAIEDAPLHWLGRSFARALSGRTDVLLLALSLCEQTFDVKIDPQFVQPCPKIAGGQ